ncbi:sensor histidine kinase [Leptolyngbya ohadii]|uniref:sensor histidine kinase n=1 Tax=Leptolyngbya ohadii TaxID=1962290 RepID=UPI0019D4535C|nr:ATP-binding protein [Leptolyngbya ohadii]
MTIAPETPNPLYESAFWGSGEMATLTRERFVEFSDVVADGDRLKQAIANLLENALKFTPQGGQVTIQLGYVGADVEITVSDTGIGIHPDFLPHVFDRFTQAEVPSRHTPGGVGIGLAIARHIVELHHGTIEGVSQGEGQGTTFTVRIPLTSAAQIKSDPQGQE